MNVDRAVAKRIATDWFRRQLGRRDVTVRELFAANDLFAYAVAARTPAEAVPPLLVDAEGVTHETTSNRSVRESIVALRALGGKDYDDLRARERFFLVEADRVQVDARAIALSKDEDAPDGDPERTRTAAAGAFDEDGFSPVETTQPPTPKKR